MNDSRIPIALIGLGWVGVHRHARAIQRSRDFKLVGVADRSFDRAAHIGRELGTSNWARAETLDNIPWISEAVAVTIATPPATHRNIAVEALAREMHVLTEKPFAISTDEGIEMASLANSVGRTLAVVHNFQFSRSARRLEQDLNTGELGKIQRIHAMQLSNPRRRLPKWYPSLRGGLFFDESPHLLYLMRRFSGGPLRLESVMMVRQHGRETTPALVQATYWPEIGDARFPVTLDMQFTSSISEWHFMVVGDRATGVVDLFRDIYIRLPNDGLHTTSTVFRTSWLASWQHWSQHLTSGVSHLLGKLDYGNDEVYRRFASAIRLREPPPDLDATSGLEILQMQHELMDKGGCNG